MKTIENKRHAVAKLLLPLLLVASGTVSRSAMADIYMYTDKDGVRWLTNTAVKGKDAKLVARTPKSKKSKELVADSPGGRVNSCLRLNHDQIEKRTAPHLEAIHKYSQSYGVEENLIRAVMRQESCFNQTARSHVGASGLMQLMPGTADMMGVSDINDPRQNIRGGAKYLAQMLERFNGDKQLALAAYNAGPGAVEKHGGVPPYRETRDYVVKVMAEYKRLEKRGQKRAPVSYARSGFQKVSLSRHLGADFGVVQD